MQNKIRQILEKSILRELALLFAGVLLGVIISLLIQNPVLDLKTGVLGALIVLLILSGSGAVSKVWHHYNLWRRRTASKIGILNDMGWDLRNKEICTGTGISPMEWKEELKGLVRNKGIEVDFISVGNYFDMYNAIINPYGGVYPEYDLRNFKIMNRILNYINEGGLFVNVADIPCYFACNPSIKPWRKIDTALRDAPYAYKVYKEESKEELIIPIKRFPLFELTPFTRELGVDVYKTEKENLPIDLGLLELENGFEKVSDISSINVKVRRVAKVKEYLDPIIKSKKMEKVTPLFFVRYGDGKLLSSLIWTQDNERRIRNELKKLLAKLVMDFILNENKK
jgi:hypothetical protein